MRNLPLFIFKVKWLRVNLDLICREGSVIKGGYCFYLYKVKWLRVNLDLICREGSVIKG